MAACTPSDVAPAAGRMPRSQPRPTARARSVVALPVAMLLAAGSGFTGFVASRQLTPAQLAAASPAAAPSRVARGASKGFEASNEGQIIQKLKEWKKAKKSGGGFAPPAPAPATPASKAAAPKVSEISPAYVPEESVPRALTARDAIGEMLKRGQADANPIELSPQQLIVVFLTFFRGWRTRAGIPGDLELTDMQRQMVILLIQGSLDTINSSCLCNR